MIVVSLATSIVGGLVSDTRYRAMCEPVLRKVGMKGECIDLHTGNRFGQVDHQVCRRDAGRVWKRKDLARLLDDEQPVAARCVGQIETIGEFEGRKSPFGHVGQRHFGRPDDAR